MASPAPERRDRPQSDHAAIWRRALQQLQDALEANVIKTYFKGTHAIEIRGGTFFVGVANPINRQTLLERYHQQVQQAVHDAAGRPLEIEFRVAPMPQQDQISPDLAPADQPSSRMPLIGSRNRQAGRARHYPVLSPNTTFERFIVGNSNQIAHAAAERVAAQPGRDMNPLFIHAPSGQGKTHLLEAIGHRVIHDYRLAYVNAEKYLRGFVDSVRFGTRPEFQEAFESAEILIVDDIEKIRSAEQAQEEFFNVFNELQRDGRQIVIASDMHPRRLMGLSDRLVTRFESGFVTKIDAADPALCRALLERCSREQQLTLNPDAAEAIAERSGGSVRTLLGRWNTVRVQAEIEREPISRALVERVLSEHETRPQRPQVLQIAELMAVVSDVTGVSPQQLIGTRRTRDVTRPRHVIFYLAKQHLDKPLTQVGAEVGGRDHSTVINGHRKVEEALQREHPSPADRWFRQTVAEVRTRLGLVG